MTFCAERDCGDAECRHCYGADEDAYDDDPDGQYDRAREEGWL